MRVDDVDQPVVMAATRTPFEASRRVFVLERVDTMNDEVANRLLKTLEEPAPFVHLILLTDALGRVIETVVSRCQLVRFEPLTSERIAELVAEGVPLNGPAHARASRWGTRLERATWPRPKARRCAARWSRSWPPLWRAATTAASRGGHSCSGPSHVARPRRSGWRWRPATG